MTDKINLLLLFLLLSVGFSEANAQFIVSDSSVKKEEVISHDLRYNKALNTLGAMICISPLINKTAGFHFGMIGTWEYYRLKNEAFKTALNFEGQILSYAANRYADNSYTDAKGVVYINNEEIRPSGVNLSIIPEFYYTKAYPILFSFGIGPSYTAANVRKTREFRYYNGGDEPYMVKYRSYESISYFSLAARLRMLINVADVVNFYTYLGIQNYETHVRPIQFGTGFTIFL
jgi:hypothetical protein